MPLTPRLRTPYPVRVVLSTPALRSFVSVWKAAGLAIAQLGAGLFFVAGVAAPVLGPATLWAVLATAVLGWFARAIDIESWALLIPGGTSSRVHQAFGPGAGRVAAAVAVVDRTVFAALAAVVTGHYVALVLAPRLRGTVAGAVAGQELATVIGVAVIGLLWMRARIGLSWRRDLVARGRVGGGGGADRARRLGRRQPAARRVARRRAAAAAAPAAVDAAARRSTR